MFIAASFTKRVGCGNSAIPAADLARWVNDVGAAAVCVARITRRAVQYPVTAQTHSEIVHGRRAAPRIGPENAITDYVAAAYLRGTAIRLFSAAPVVLAVDDTVATATGISVISLCHDGSLAAEVGPVVVDLASAAGRVPAVGTIFHRTIAAERSPAVVDRRTTTTSERAVGPGYDVTTATLMCPVAVGKTAAASGATTEIVPSQLPRATDIFITVVDLIVTAAVGGVYVDLRSAASGI